MLRSPETKGAFSKNSLVRLQECPEVFFPLYGIGKRKGPMEIPMASDFVSFRPMENILRIFL
jgi:hypothetical protein